MVKESIKMKRVILVHGWGGSPINAWFPWLKKELQIKGFEVIVPKMPDTDDPSIDVWVPYLANVVQKADKNTYFVGHSIGCQTIMRYLETLKEGTKVGGAVFVAGFFRLPHLETDEEKVIAKPWLKTPINFIKIKKHINKIITIFSDDDPDVDLSDKDMFKKNLGTKTIVEHGMGHFSDDAGIKKLPSALKSLLKISK